MTVNFERVETASIIAYFKDFDGGVEKWREGFFELMATMNTWGTILDMYCNCSPCGSYIRLILANKEAAPGIVSDMTGLGYREIKVNDAAVGVVDLLDGDIDYLVAE